jgi:hypothetical protein
MIDFSQLGFIGKAFQSADLLRLAHFLLLFYDQMPCDLLVGDWMMSMVQNKRIDYWRKYPSLFQHVGMFRSLGGFQPLQEKRYGKQLFDNPLATIAWDFSIVPTYEGKFAYFGGGEKGDRNDVCDFKASKAHKGKVKRCWFWAKGPITTGQHLTLIFEKSIKLKGVFVEFGQNKHPDDLLYNGIVAVADDAASGVPEYLPSGVGKADHCGKFHNIQDVRPKGKGNENDAVKANQIYWEEKVSIPKELPVPKVRCLRIAADKPQTSWMIVHQILITSK